MNHKLLSKINVRTKHYVLICHEINPITEFKGDRIEGVYADFKTAVNRFNELQDEEPCQVQVDKHLDGEPVFDYIEHWLTYRLEVWFDRLLLGNIRRSEAEMMHEPVLYPEPYVCDECNCSSPTHRSDCSLWNKRIGDVVCDECGYVNGHSHTCSHRHDKIIIK